MKKIIVFAASVFFLMALSYGNSEYYSYSYARLSYVKGDVFIQRTGDLGYEEGTVNMLLVEGDKLGTREGQAEIHFGRKNYLRVDQYSQIDLAGLPTQNGDLVKIHFLTGSIFLRVSFLDREKDFEIHTPDASFYIMEKGLYRIDVRENRETELLVCEGSVEAVGEEESFLVRDEEMLVASDGRFPDGPDYSNADYEDSFSRWNTSRDDLYNQGVSRNYLPAELYEYESELASYGRWVYERPYGYVWTPYVYNSMWRPYYYGRWAWYPIIGWTWVSYEPWGWSVYHYGRWHWRVGLGWYWIPTRTWGPAWVHWFRSNDYIGWCPLSYYNYPVVIINNHFYGQFYDRDYPIHSRALTVVHKSQLQEHRISHVALSQNDIVRLGKVSLSPTVLKARAEAINTGKLHSEAANLFSNSKVRAVKKGYTSDKTVRSYSPRKTSKISNSMQKIERSSALRKISPVQGKARRISSSEANTRALKKYQPSSAKQRLSTGNPDFSSKSPQSRAKVKNYPSQKASPSRQKLTRSLSLSPRLYRARSQSYSRSKIFSIPDKSSSPRRISSATKNFSPPSSSSSIRSKLGGSSSSRSSNKKVKK